MNCNNRIQPITDREQLKCLNTGLPLVSSRLRDNLMDVLELHFTHASYQIQPNTIKNPETMLRRLYTQHEVFFDCVSVEDTVDWKTLLIVTEDKDGNLHQWQYDRDTFNSLVDKFCKQLASKRQG